MSLLLHRMKDRKIDVLGLGRSGLAAAKALSAAGASVRVWDDNASARECAASQGYHIDSEVGGHPADVLVLSPGIPHSFPVPHPCVKRARQAGIKILGDIELLWEANQSVRYIGITGTNGKSTTTALIGHLLKTNCHDVEVGGNIGTPALALSLLKSNSIYVLELSSYQLELIEEASFDVSVILNINQDHLDRHGGMDGYISAKVRILGGNRPGAVAIIGVDDPVSADLADRVEAAGFRRVVRISGQKPISGGVGVEGGWLVCSTSGVCRPIIDLAPVRVLAGDHNHQNIAAAYAATQAVGLTEATFVTALPSFPGLAHRQNLVATLGQVRFVNDSKATNAAAAARALKVNDAIWWIAGGIAKEGGLDGLEPWLDHIRHAFLIGQAAPAFSAWLNLRGVPTTIAGTLEQAVMAAAAAASKATEPCVVLLSPACASFDQFRNFEARGDAFVASVQRWLQGETLP